ncbi:MAG: sigma-70 family RNA polymerase sigma factor [Planctomycetota bacterium]|nr:sigma-70 family RNA polymerase sigma factor [Planctomycetota bacterium]MDP7250816.1 sigma-70 family RNA polymerase sigma factor [Planctomycetota bacterium]
MNEDLSDEQLMLMFRYGNRSAFELLFEKHRGPVYRFALRMLGERAAAEDACQDTFLKVVSSSGGYEPTAKFRTWLYTIARNVCLNELRKPSLVRFQTLHEIESTGEGDPSHIASSAELLDHLDQAIARLPDAWREIFLLRSSHRMSYEEIAAITQVPLGTVKTNLHRARLRLAEAMQHLYGDPS